jgi:hypothetical protein
MMKRSILLTCTGLLLAACASGADVAEDDPVADSAVVDVLGGAPAQSPDSANQQTP